MRDYSSYSDEQLLHLLKEGNESAFGILYDRYAPSLLESAAKQLNNLQAAEELLHDVFMNIWRLRETAEIQNPEAYLRQSMRHGVINYVLRKKQPAFFTLFDAISSSPYMADQPVRQKELITLIQALISALPEKRKQVFIRHYFRHQTTREIASDMHLSEKTVQNQISLSLSYLRTRLGQLFTVVIFLSLVF